jgi:WD40 repeat protein/biotin carboxyl carrier protein
MLRFLVTVLVVSAVPIGLVLYYTGGVPADDSVPPVSSGQRQTPRPPEQKAEGAPPPAEKEDLLPQLPIVVTPQVDGRRRSAPVFVSGHLLPNDRQEVPSERDGTLVVIGTELAPGEEVSASRKFAATVGYLIIPMRDKDNVSPDQVILGAGGSRWRRWLSESDTDPEPGRVFVRQEKKWFKRLEVGDEVKAGEVVALVDPALALGDLRIKRAGLDSSESDLRASIKTKEEAERRVASMEESMRRVPGSVSKDDYEGAKLTARRYFEEEVAKRSAVVKAQQELIQAQTIVTKHEIRSTISGVIKILYKNRGDAVKSLDPIMQLQSRDPLRLEALLDVQETSRIKAGKTPVIVEPSQPIAPKLVLEGHLGEVTCVAVSRGKEPVILSGAEDQTLRGWNPATGQQLWRFPYRTSIRCVTCTGPEASHSLALAALADGTARLIDLDKLDEFIKGKAQQQPEPVALQGRHKGAIRCVAFSPDGETCATGGDDRRIFLWKTATGDLRGELPPQHRAPVTSLQFTKDNHLVSAASDNTLVIWSVEEGKPPARVTGFDHRGGDVAQLGVSPDGKRVLFDQGREIRLLSIESGRVEGIFRNVSGTSTFTTMALFDPDGLTVLTNGASEGRLQLWRTPTPDSTRASEVRQLVWTRGSATSGAFSPDRTFCVTGMQDRHVLVWQMPERKQAGGGYELVETPIHTHIKKVEEFIDSSNGQVRVWADVDNKDNRLLPGGTATMVILPEDK